MREEASGCPPSHGETNVPIVGGAQCSARKGTQTRYYEELRSMRGSKMRVRLHPGDQEVAITTNILEVAVDVEGMRPATTLQDSGKPLRTER